eukprot:21402-Amphidinium_carterae.2
MTLNFSRDRPPRAGTPCPCEPLFPKAAAALSASAWVASHTDTQDVDGDTDTGLLRSSSPWV